MPSRAPTHEPADEPAARTGRGPLAFGRIGTKPLARLCHNVGTALHAGVDVRRVWETESHRGSTMYRNRMAEVRDRVAGGDTVTSALAATRGYFPPLVVEMVEVGERTGRLEQVFLRLAEHYDRVLKLQRDFLMGIAWPMFELTLGIFIIGVLILVLGLIGGEQNFGVFGLSGWSGLAIYATIVGTIAVVIGGVIFGVRQGLIGVDPLIRLLMYVPGLGGGLKTLALSRLTWSLSLATDSDIDPRRALELAVRTTQNTYYTRHIEGMKLVITRGGEMHDAFQQTHAFPDDFLDALQTGEITGQISESMAVLAREYEARAKNFYRVLAVVAGLTVFLMVAAMMIFMIFQLFYTFILGPIQGQLDSM